MMAMAMETDTVESNQSRGLMGLSSDQLRLEMERVIKVALEAIVKEGAEGITIDFTWKTLDPVVEHARLSAADVWECLLSLPCICCKDRHDKSVPVAYPNVRNLPVARRWDWCIGIDEQIYSSTVEQTVARTKQDSPCGKLPAGNSDRSAKRQREENEVREITKAEVLFRNAVQSPTIGRGQDMPSSFGDVNITQDNV